MLNRYLPAVLGASLLFASAGANASYTVEYGGAGDPSLQGATGSLTISLDEGTADPSDYFVRWSISTTGFDDTSAIATDHDELTHVAFKAFTDVTSVSFLDSSVLGETGAGLVYPAKFNGECTDGEAGFMCLTLSEQVSMLPDGLTYTYDFHVSGTLSEEWSYRGKFGDGTGWVISEDAASPVPEPTAAAVFGAGLLTVAGALRRTRTS